MKFYLLLLFVAATCGKGVKNSEEDSCQNWWCYKPPNKCGASNWPKQCPLCGGDFQSPINIKRSKVKYDDSLGVFEFGGDYLSPGLGFPLHNNGHTVVVDASSEAAQLTISEGGLPGTYKLVQIHFHWGSHNGKGSEHRLDRWKFPGEVHFVHVKSMYDSIADALAHTEDTSSIAVLATFIVLGPHNAAYDGIVDNLYSVKYPGNQSYAELQEDIASLFPRNFQRFYRYHGSLTTPPCNEVVIWSVFQDPVFMSSYQLTMFRSLINSHGEPLVNNYRPKKGVNGRTIKSNYYG